MTDELGYSIRGLAGKLGKDKGYVENRLRLATAPDDIKQMVSQRHDTLAAAYELLKVEDRKKRRALVKRIVEEKLPLARLRERIAVLSGNAPTRSATAPATLPPLKDDALIAATRKLQQALSELSRAVGGEGPMAIPESDRENLAKFLSIKRTHLDNLVARLRQRRG